MNQDMHRLIVWGLRSFGCFYVSLSLSASASISHSRSETKQKYLGRPIPTLQSLACKQVVKQLSASEGVERELRESVKDTATHKLITMDRFKNNPEEVERELRERVNNLAVQRMIMAKLFKPYKPKIAARNIAEGPLYRDEIGADVLEFNADGSRLAIATKKISIWDIRMNKILLQIAALSNYPRVRIAALAFHPLDNQLAVGTNFGHKFIYDLSNGKLLHRLRDLDDLFRREIERFAYSPDGKLLVSISYPHTISIWDAQQGNHLRTVPDNSAFIRFVGDNKICIYKAGFVLFDINTGTCVPAFLLRDSNEAFWSYYRKLNSGYRRVGNSLAFYDLKDKEMFAITPKGNWGPATTSSDGSQIAIQTVRGVRIVYAAYETVLEDIDITQALYVYKKLKEKERSRLVSVLHMLSQIWSQKPSPAAETYFKQMQEQLPDSFKRVLK